MSAFLKSPGQFDLLLTMSGLDTGCGPVIADCMTPNAYQNVVVTDPVVMNDYTLAADDTVTNPLVSGTIRLKRGAWNDPLARHTPFRYLPDDECPVFPFPVPYIPCKSGAEAFGITVGDDNVAQPSSEDFSRCMNLWAWYSGWKGGYDEISELSAIPVPAEYGRALQHSDSDTDCTGFGSLTHLWRMTAYAWPLIYDFSDSAWETNDYFLCVLDPAATAPRMHCSGWSVLIQFESYFGSDSGGTVFFGQVELDNVPDGSAIVRAYDAEPLQGAVGLNAVILNAEYDHQVARTATQMGLNTGGTVTLTTATAECE